MHIDEFKEHFHAVTDKRQSAKVTYCLFEVLFGSLCPVIGGAKGWFDIREYILGHHDWFKRNDMFINGIPAVVPTRIIERPVAIFKGVISMSKSIRSLFNGSVELAKYIFSEGLSLMSLSNLR
ncbi:H repeat-associated protein N-terminal domain-containing protein [Vibrio rarus]